ncbi:NADH dehydrogenase (quinone) subunit D [Candidatus Magnetomonas plexicatena]|uniref:NADH dehydrogenase (quinone) subunit D n=1 Tax=Candidatus Magnetomonas plexicatena TaxID=2552947 RepID=UPI001C767A66|nr:NADH dehydrogenase (quinone) subunit D [Nitrospirales bacterium LBB_01]
MEPLKDLNTRELVLNMGPQHPSTHGVLRLKLELDGETIKKCTPYVGYLHRGTEKLAEGMTYMQCMPLTDRLDYISSMTNNVGYCLAVERLFGIEAPIRAKYIRTIVSEVSRISSHLLWLATHALDIGAMTVFLYAFREREFIMDLFEMLCGARLTVSYPRIGGVKNDVTQEFIDKLYDFLLDFPSKIEQYETLINVNRIWLQRTVGVGIISAADAINWGLSGATLRGSGVNYDIRKHFPYDAYYQVEFAVPIGKNGDVYDRYLCRMEEMRQSVSILKQCVEKLPTGPIMAPDAPKFTLPPKDRVLSEMESLIHQFTLITKGPMTAPKGEIYVATEAPKGELGFFIVSDGTGRPFRMRIRAPSFVHVSALPSLCEGGLIADAIANIGSIDVVLGECDR